MGDEDRRDHLKIAVENVGWGIELLTKEVDELRAAGDAMADELSRHGWGDLHYSLASGQEPSVVAALAAWKAARRWEEG